MGDVPPVEFEFTATAPGVFVVELALQRPWERVPRRIQRVVLEVLDNDR